MWYYDLNKWGLLGFIWLNPLFLFEQPFYPRFTLIGVIHDSSFTTFFHAFTNCFCLQTFVISFDGFPLLLFDFSPLFCLFPFRFSDCFFVLLSTFSWSFRFRRTLSKGNNRKTNKNDEKIFRNFAFQNLWMM